MTPPMMPMLTDSSKVVLDLVLVEIRELRAAFSEYSRQTGERLSVLETHDHMLNGNGQPGRVADLEKAVADLNKFRYWLLGASAAVGAITSLLMRVVLK